MLVDGALLQGRALLHGGLYACLGLLAKVICHIYSLRNNIGAASKGRRRAAAHLAPFGF